MPADPRIAKLFAGVERRLADLIAEPAAASPAAVLESDARTLTMALRYGRPGRVREAAIDLAAMALFSTLGGHAALDDLRRERGLGALGRPSDAR